MINEGRDSVPGAVTNDSKSSNADLRIPFEMRCLKLCCRWALMSATATDGFMEIYEFGGINVAPPGRAVDAPLCGRVTPLLRLEASPAGALLTIASPADAATRRRPWSAMLESRSEQ